MYMKLLFLVEDLVLYHRKPTIPELKDESRFGSEMSSALEVAKFCYYCYINGQVLEGTLFVFTISS